MRYTMMFLFIIAAGCTREAIMPDEPELFQESSLVLNPADGAASVRLDAAIELSFSRPMDRAVVQRGLHLIGENAMADSLCPVSQTMGHGSMGNSMIDSSKMRHLDQYHSTRGRLIWNADSTRCTFQPDSMMTPRTLYMIHMDREMTFMMEQRMGKMGMMGGHGSGSMGGEMMFHFFTLDTTKSGSGHSSHH